MKAKVKMETDEPFLGLCMTLQKLSYGLGHVFNDLCAAMWFSYTLFYLQVVLQMESATAGILIMIGQVIDSLTTPLAGWAIDYIGCRKLCHLGGTMFVGIGFISIFSLRPTTFTPLVLAYYIIVIIVFQIGWAIVQISHLSTIPEISKSESQSSELTAIRYFASVCCNISVYIITLVILKSEETEAIGPNDFFKFKEIALIITFAGALSSMLFYCGLLRSDADDSDYSPVEGGEILQLNDHNGNNGKHFLKSYIIYCVSLMYMSARLFNILNLVYMPLFIDERAFLDNLQKENIRQTIAMVPLVCYIASLITAIFLKYRGTGFNDKIVYCFGSLIGLGAAIWIGVGISPSDDQELFIISALLGVSSSSTVVTSLCLTAKFVKTNGYEGGFIYSVVTFTDKLVSGAVVLLVQHLRCNSRSDCPHFYENVLTYLLGCVALSGLFSLMMLQCRRGRNLTV